MELGIRETSGSEALGGREISFQNISIELCGGLANSQIETQSHSELDALLAAALDHLAAPWVVELGAASADRLSFLPAGVDQFAADPACDLYTDASRRRRRLGVAGGREDQDQERDERHRDPGQRHVSLTRGQPAQRRVRPPPVSFEGHRAAA